MCHRAQRASYIGCFSSCVKSGILSPQFCDECFHYMNELYFEATADTFWGCRLDIKMIEHAKQREDFHTKQILGTLTGFNILGWLVKVVSLLKSGGSLLINPKTLKDVSPQCHKGLLLVRKTLADKGVVRPSLKSYTLVESKKRKKTSEYYNVK